jgi:hypothetical protein
LRKSSNKPKPSMRMPGKQKRNSDNKTIVNICERGKMINSTKKYKEPLFQELSPSARHVLEVLINYADSKQCLAFPGYTTLEQATGRKRQTIADAIYQLEIKNAINVIRKKGFHNYYDMSKWRCVQQKEKLSRKFQLLLAKDLHKNDESASAQMGTST